MKNPPVSGSLLLHDLFQVAAIKNEDGMPVIKYVSKPNGGSVAYVRHDAMVNKLNSLNTTNTNYSTKTSNMKNLNEFAKYITQQEGKKVQVNIAQVKEILSIVKKKFKEDPIGFLKLFVK